MIKTVSSARYVRLVCRKRFTGYGSSLYELEVYGSGRWEDETAVEEISVYSDSQIFKFIKDGQICISRNGIVYSVDGRMLMRTQER